MRDMSTGRARVDEAFREALSIFGELVQELGAASPERRAELLEEAKEMSELLGREIPSLCQAAGATEPEIATLMKSPNQFSEEHWKLLQSTQQALSDLAATASKALKGAALESPPSQESHTKSKGSKKSNWMKG